MRRLPDDVYDLIEDGKWDELKRYYDEVPELKRMMERVWRERTGPSKEDGGPCSSGVGDPPADVSIHGSIGNE